MKKQKSEQKLQPLGPFELIVAYSQYQEYVEKSKKRGTRPLEFEEWCNKERRKNIKKYKED